MPVKTTVIDPVTGTPYEGEPVEIVESQEPWSSFRLADGSTIRARVVAAKAFRTDGYRPDGAPIYVLMSQLVLSVDSPENLMRSSAVSAKGKKRK